MKISFLIALVAAVAGVALLCTRLPCWPGVLLVLGSCVLLGEPWRKRV